MLAGMREDFLELCDRDHVRVVAFLMRCGACDEDARDAAQEAFLSGWRMLTQDPDKWQAIGNPAGWLRRTAHNCWKRPPGLPRTIRELPVNEVPDQTQPGSDPAESVPMAITVQQAVARLDDQARIIWSFHRDGFRNVEIAELLETDAQKVADVLKTVRRTLRPCVNLEEGRTR